jgi:hypothetical protein
VVPVGEKTTYLDWLGPDYVAALEGMLSQQCSGTGRAPACWADSCDSPRDGPCHTPLTSLRPFHLKL